MPKSSPASGSSIGCCSSRTTRPSRRRAMSRCGSSSRPDLYRLTYFPFMFLVTTPFVWLFDHVGVIWDQRYLYLPAYIGSLALVPFLVQGASRRLAMTAAIALNPQLFPFVVEGRNDFF